MENQKYNFSITPYIDRGRKALYPDENRIERRHWMWNESGISELYFLLLNHLLNEEQRSEYYKSFRGKDFTFDIDRLVNYCLEVVDGQKYIWSISDEEHGVVSVWDTREEAIQEIMIKYADGDEEWFGHCSESEDGNTLTWGDDFEVTVQRQPVGESFGWIY